jgi:hypothetical protein
MSADTDRKRLLESVGFAVLGTVDEAGGVSPGQVWRSAVNLGAEPAVRVDAEADDALDGAERAWRGRGEETGLFAPDGSFLISLPGPGALEAPWNRVRGGTETGFLRALAESTGSPDFVSMAVSGPPAVALTEEEWELWIIDVLPAGSSMR